MSRIVVALGGNALGNTPAEQLKLVKNTAIAIVEIIKQGNDVIVTHGNGPQVGMINLAFDLSSKLSTIPTIPFPECGAMSQGYIGFHLQNAIQDEFINQNINKKAAAIITQVIVDADDPAFLNPTKPIGPFYELEEAKRLEIENLYVIKEDAGRGFRRVVASPKPIGVVEIEIIKTLIDAKHTVITVGGGGIPVVRVDNQHHGIAAVIDKDFASAKLAELIDADFLCILTAVDKVSLNFGSPNQIDLDSISISDAEEYIECGHFAKGSMLPKVEAALEFVKTKNNRTAIIASLENAALALKGQAGTIIHS